METNWFIVAGVVIIGLFLIFFLVKRNYKDEKNYTNYLKKNDPTQITDEDLDKDTL